jgi:cytochrome d ubiquinol oxidase subunit I
MDVVLLSRIQFALTIMFHYLFPPLTIGMGIVLVYLEARYLKTRIPLYEIAAKFWTKIFALNFAIGVATGIVMEFQFGTNWAAYSRYVGDVFGSALAAEGIFAFFLESGFLAVLVFGWDRVGPKMHFFSTVMVALGSIFSAIWIVVANSWQQTPTGHHIVQVMKDGQPWFLDGLPVLRAEVVDFWAVVFNPSTVHRLTHVIIGAFIMGTFFIMSISAYYLLRQRHIEFARHSFRGALLFATLSSIAILFSGHLQARNVYEHQPAKLAAFEGHFQTGRGDLSLFGIPDEKNQTVHANIAIPGGLSFLLHDDFTTDVVGLDKFAPEHQPPVLIPFLTYHIMIALGVFFIVVTLLASLLLWRGKLYEQRWLLWIFVFAVLGAVAANQAGWAAAEVGRQPWIVNPPLLRDADGKWVENEQGHLQFEMVAQPLASSESGAPRMIVAGLRTDEAVSEVIRSEQVLSSIILFGLIYLLLGLVWVFVLNHKIHQGPEPAPLAPGDEGFFEAAAARPAHEQSMTEAHDQPPQPPENHGERG